MNRPEKLVFSDDSYWGLTVAGLAFLAFGFGVVLAITDVTLADLILPLAALGGFWFVWVVFHGFIAWIHRARDRRAISRMFESEIWERWQFPAREWQAIVNAECNLIAPNCEGARAYVGAVYSSIAGFVFAAILVTVGAFAIQDPLGKTIFRICAVAVFLLFLGVGSLQPISARYKARRYRRRALRVPEPRVWFASDGIYHETLGYTSLKKLKKVTDHIRSRKAIKFTLEVTAVIGHATARNTRFTYLIPYSFPIPSGCEERGARLVRRYRQEYFGD